jgi:glycosyltransferase involved in cell wall biosynthesis
VADAVRDGETGLHARFGASESLAEVLDRLLGDAELRSRLGAGARAFAERELSARLQLDRYVELYEELVAA